MGRVVGIDLGTTNSVVSVMEAGKPVVIANAEGLRTTPSVVAFSKEGDRFIGQMARRQAVLDPKNTFYNVKRFIGRQYAELSAEDKRVPYRIRRSEDNTIRLVAPRLQREFAPEELSAMIIRKLADEAGRYLGQPVTGAVITVPAYFNDSQRQATRDAGRIAGLDVKRILNEPTAASLAYGLDRAQRQTILVFDLGGGTFDVSILNVGDGVFEVLSTSGDTQLGGNDFDRKIVNWLAEQFLEAEGIDLRRERQSLQRLNEAAEKAKIELSGLGVTDINLPFIAATEAGPKHLEARLTRGEFELMSVDLLERIRLPVRRAIKDGGLRPQDINEVVLVGGSTRMPMVQDLVRSFINLEPNQNVNPDEVVAVGAAIQAGIIAGDVRDVLLLDVTPLSVGLETIGGVMKTLIPRNTPVPVRKSDVFSTAEANQTLVEIHVLQGEREMAAGNKSLGRFKLMGIPPAPRGVPQIQVSFDIDSNGILLVTALDRTTGREQTVTIQGASTLSDTEVNRMIQDAEAYALVDRQKKARIEKRNSAESLVSKAERKLREVAIDFGMYFAESQRKRVDAYIRELKDYIKADDDRGMDLTQGDLQEALANLEREIKFRLEDEEDDGILQSIRETFKDVKDSLTGEDDYRRPDDRYGRYGKDPYAPDPYGSGGYDSGGYGSGGYGPRQDSYGPGPYGGPGNSRGQGSYDRPPSGDRPRESGNAPDRGRGGRGDRPNPRYDNPYSNEEWGDDNEWI